MNEDKKAMEFHAAYKAKAQECREKEFPEPSTTDYGMGYGDGYRNGWSKLSRT